MAKTKTARRGQGEGSIIQLKNGTYQGRITIGYDANGKQKRKAFYGKTKREVQEKMDVVKVELNKGSYVEPSNITVAEWLDTWLQEYQKRKISRNTYCLTYDAIERYIKPSIGHYKLKALRPEMVQKLINDVSDSGRSLTMLYKAYYALNMALRQAEKNGLVGKNVASLVQPPKDPKKEKRGKVRVLTGAEQDRFMDAAKNTYVGELFILILATGLRIGEALALTFDDIDFEKGTLSVNKSVTCCRDPDQNMKRIKYIGPPKTKSSYREIPLLPSILDMLKIKKEYPKNKKNLVFPSSLGDTYTIGGAEARFAVIARKAEIEDAHIHTLRHTFATRGLENGIELRVMQDLLGHASYKETADTYTHVLPDKKKDSIFKLSDIFDK